MTKNQTFRIKTILCILFALVTCYIYFLVFQSRLIPGSNPDGDERVSALEKQKEREETMEGSILDRNGTPLSVATEVGEPAELIYPEETSFLLGYNSKSHGTSGLRSRYSDYLYRGGKDDIGATLNLTIDSELQRLSYGIIGNSIGSIIVLDNETGEILSCVSRSSADVPYNANLIEENSDTYNEIEAFYFNRATFAQDPPGSTFKLITATALLETGNDTFTIEDSGEFMGIHNARNVVYGTIDLAKALIKSINTYFANAGVYLGGPTLEDVCKRFMIGTPIELDFTTLHSNLDLENYEPELVASTSFGQGKLKLSPLHISMILSGILNDGELMKPFLVKEISDDEKIIKTTKPEILSQVCSSETSEEMKHLLNKVAISYGFDEKTYGKVYAKTGTAQLGNGKEYNHIYLVFGTDKYSCIISKDCSFDSSHSLAAPAKEILKYLSYKEI